MCAIFGVVGEYDKELAIDSFELLSHRGVDGCGIVEERDSLLASCRLAITDIKSAYQPYRIDSAIVLFNGEIYNYRELARELDCQEIESEVIYYSFKRYGVEFISKLRGQFAIAIVEGTKVVLARDLFGKKPLYYQLQNNTLIFSSEPRAILNYSDSYRFDRKILAQLLFFQSVIPPNSLYRGINQLSPSEVLVIEKFQAKSHFPYSPIKPKVEIDREDALKEMDRVLNESVAFRIPEEVKWGCLLSGGLDSSLVSSIASKYTDELNTFSIGYDGFEKYDERRYARVVSKHIGSNHYEFSMNQDSFLESLDEIISHLDEPILDPAIVPLWHLMKQINKEGFKVVLSGDGSDELFLGYRLYREYFDIEKAKDLRYKNWLKNYFRANFSMNKEWERYKRVFSDTLLFRSMAELYTDLQLNRLLKINVADDNSLQAIKSIRERFIGSGGIDERDWYSYCDINTLLSELFLKKLDRVSMAHAIEARSPFLDKNLVEYIFSLESSLRLSDEVKLLLKDVAKEYLPREIIYRKKKGFSYPFIEWLRSSGELDKIYQAQERFSLFNDEALDALLNRSKKQSRFKHHIYALYFTSAWMLKHF